ncbi:Asp-tRNA(Asn)/Glu-tRNA(Gln) amidotransferase subunit GatA [Desulfovibrio sp. OttesenSCG-928-F07]|nr:Asp-tRNA(Asn)/Glu-tRNA(Gln) amidotransferase subunit GatA [Desulfovibrio sp. OttesenSCG-928-F07]
MSGLYKLTLSEAREGLVNKKFSSLELTQSCLERIKVTEPKINACTQVLEDYAVDTAKKLDAAGPDKDMPLWGIPLMLKDLICLKGFKTTCASKFLENFVPFYDAEVAARFKNAGAVIVAKNNMDEFAMGSTTENSAFTRTANPWDLERVPGGSSGGSAASVAACQAFGSLGSDTGGSIRQPAGFCGCAGIKPTYGRVSRYGVVAFGSSFDQVGPLGRTVEDCARMFEVIAGPDPKDSTSARLDLYGENLPEQNFVAVAEASKAKDVNDIVKGLKIGVPQEFWDSGLSGEVEHSCKDMLKKLEDAGATLVPVSLPNQKYAVAVYYIMASAEASTNLARFDGIRYGRRAEGAEDLIDLYTKSRTQGFGPEVQRRIMLGTFVLSSGYYDAYYRKAAQIRRLLRNDFDAALNECDMLIAPTATRTAWNFGFAESDPLSAYKMDLLTVTLNLVGLPGISVPVGLGSDSGMPVGIQLMGKAFDEAALIKAATAIEKLAPKLGTPTALI